MTNSIARDQLRQFVERIERMESEKKTIADDIRDIYAEAKSLGFCTKTLKKIVALRKKDENERAEEEAILDMYKAALGMIPQLDMFDKETGEVFDREASRRRIMSEDMADHKSLVDEMADAGLISEEAREENKRLADAVATKFGSGPVAALQSTRKAAEAVSERTANEHPHHLKTTGGDESGTLEGSVEDHRQAAGRSHESQTDGIETVTVGGDESGTAINPEMDRATEGSFETGSEAAEKGRKATATIAAPADLNHAGAGESPATDFAPASHGEAEGAVIRFELCPSRPMKRLPFVHCFPDLTKTEYDRLSISISENGVEDPIIRDGDTIVDGWNRYNIARSLGMEYPVKKFEGGDVLSFVIDAQRASRGWSQSQERKIAAALCKELPHRAKDINAAFQIEEEFA